jgi:hypothetical protein
LPVTLYKNTHIQIRLTKIRSAKSKYIFQIREGNADTSIAYQQQAQNGSTKP